MSKTRYNYLNLLPKQYNSEIERERNLDTYMKLPYKQIKMSERM